MDCHTFASTIKSASFRILKLLAVFFTAESPAHRMMLDWNKYWLGWKWKTVLESEMVPRMIYGLQRRAWSVCLWASLCPHVTHLQPIYTWIAPSTNLSLSFWCKSRSCWLWLSGYPRLWLLFLLACCDPQPRSAVVVDTLMVSRIERHLWRCRNPWIFP